jgi:hypothetical protein
MAPLLYKELQTHKCISFNTENTEKAGVILYLSIFKHTVFMMFYVPINSTDYILYYSQLLPILYDTMYNTH